MFSEGRNFIEPIFYTAGSHIGFDHLSLAPKLYQFDREFLSDRGYKIEEFASLLDEMQGILELAYETLFASSEKTLENAA